ncbi:unnamed protein product, partial [Polarella glacialis]
LERQKTAQADNFHKMLAGIDANDLFREDSGPAKLDFAVSGAMPPVSSSRVADAAQCGAAVANERRAAEKMLEERRRSDLRRVRQQAANQRLELRAAREEGQGSGSEAVEEEDVDGGSIGAGPAAGTDFEKTLAAFHREVERSRVQPINKPSTNNQDGTYNCLLLFPWFFLVVSILFAGVVG